MKQQHSYIVYFKNGTEIYVKGKSFHEINCFFEDHVHSFIHIGQKTKYWNKRKKTWQYQRPKTILQRLLTFLKSIIK